MLLGLFDLCKSTWEGEANSTKVSLMATLGFQGEGAPHGCAGHEVEDRTGYLLQRCTI